MYTRHESTWLLTREYEGLAGAGGVKDVCRELAEALAKKGHRVHVVLPAYGFLDPGAFGFSPAGITFSVDVNYVLQERREAVTVWSRTEGKLTLYLLEADRFREKKGVYTYTAEEEAKSRSQRRGMGHYDYFAMNVLHQKAALALMMLLDERPDIIHCHDGHTALVPAMIRELEGFRHYFTHTACLVTIHNAGIGYHQEVADLPFAHAVTSLPFGTIAQNLLSGAFNPFLAASRYALMNTVSENYARELQETDYDALTGWLGHQLKKRKVVIEGVTNGINPTIFDPTAPGRLGLSAGFNPETGEFAGKDRVRGDLVRSLGPGGQTESAEVRQIGFLDRKPDLPLLTFVGRLTLQKGVDNLAEALARLLEEDQGFQVVILGNGQHEFEESLAELAADTRHAGRLCVLLGFDPILANRIFASGDFFLIPSQYEPCGLTDFMAQLAGNLPIVHHIGGLVKVLDGETGFAYTEHTSEALRLAVHRALTVFRQDPRQIGRMQKAAIAHIRRHYTWDKVVERYQLLYDKARGMVGR